MIRRLLLLLIMLFLADLVLLFVLTKATSGWVTLGVIVGTGILGIAVLRGRRAAWRAARMGAASGATSGTNVVDGAMLLIAGVLLIAPGLIADACGLLLLVPQVRRRVRQVAAAWFAHRTRTQFEQMAAAMRAAQPQAPDPHGPNVIDAEFTKEVVDSPPKLQE